MEVGSDRPKIFFCLFSRHAQYCWTPNLALTHGDRGKEGEGAQNLVGWLSRALSTPVAERLTKSRRPAHPLFPIISSWNKRVPDT